MICELMTNNCGDEILVHPDKVEWMRNKGWIVIDQADINEDEEVKENGSDNRS